MSNESESPQKVTFLYKYSEFANRHLKNQLTFNNKKKSIKLYRIKLINKDNY